MPRTRGPRVKRARAHQATIFGEDPEAKFRWLRDTPVTSPLRGAAFQLERCPTTGNLHVQAFLRWDRKLTGIGVQRFLNEECHLEDADDQAAAIRYATKEATRVQGPVFVGDVRSSQGRRTDLLMVQEAINEGATTEELYSQHFSVVLRHWAGVQRYRNFVARRTTRDPPEVRVYWGPTGVGKSRRASFEASQHGGGYRIPLPDRAGDPVWFGEYDGVEPCIIEEFTGQWSVDFAKRVFDRYHVDVPVKGGHVAFRPRLIIITSNQDPKDWWPFILASDWACIQRRLNVVEHMTTDWEPPVSDACDLSFPATEILSDSPPTSPLL